MPAQQGEKRKGKRQKAAERFLQLIQGPAVRAARWAALGLIQLIQLINSVNSVIPPRSSHSDAESRGSLPAAPLHRGVAGEQRWGWRSPA